MSTGTKVVLGVLTVMVLTGVIALTSLMGIYNNCVSLEQTLEAQYKQNQNSYDKMYKTLVEMAGVKDSYAQDFKNIYDGLMKGRYGNDGSNQLFKMITESNPTLDSSVYKQLQQAIESNRGSFSADQKTLLDKKQVYQSFLNQVPGGLIAKFMGFPKIDLAKIDIVTSDKTDKAFETKKDEPMNLGPKETK